MRRASPAGQGRGLARSTDRGPAWPEGVGVEFTARRSSVTGSVAVKETVLEASGPYVDRGIPAREGKVSGPTGLDHAGPASHHTGLRDPEGRTINPRTDQRMPSPRVGVIMGSRSDWETMSHAAETLKVLAVPHEVKVVSAHRTPDVLFQYASSAEERGLKVIIAGAGGAAHLAGVAASKTLIPVLGVPVQSRALQGLDSLLSIVQMPAGVPVGTLAIGQAGAINSALLAAAILATGDSALRERIRQYRKDRAESVLRDPDPSVGPS